MDPAALKFAKSHEWVGLDGETATIGISKFAVDALTDLVYLELPDVGASFDAGAIFGVVESVKAASDLYLPVSGEVVEVNEALPDDLGMLSDEPYDGGWIVKIELAKPEELDGLMDNAAYTAHCESQ
ncbi:MAG: glycine cleavage system protein GcvH [Planctomycetaceae bacterium]